MKFTVQVCRISYAFTEIEVEAKSAKQAKDLALDESGDHNYSEKDADYKVVMCDPSREKSH